MITNRYFYNRLSDHEKEIYTALYKGATALQKEIYHPNVVSKETVHRIFNVVTHDNPYLYYFNLHFQGEPNCCSSFYHRCICKAEGGLRRYCKSHKIALKHCRCGMYCS